MKDERERSNPGMDSGGAGGEDPEARGGNLSTRMLWSAARARWQFRGPAGARDSGTVSAGEPAGRFAADQVFCRARIIRQGRASTTASTPGRGTATSS